MRLAVVVVSCLLTLACRAPVRHLPGTNPALPYSKAVLVGDTVHVAGHTGTDPATGAPPADVAAEIELMLDAFEATLTRADVTWDDLVSVEVFCTDPVHYEVFNAAYARRFSTTDYPARAFVGCGPLLRGCRFEMLGTALRR